MNDISSFCIYSELRQRALTQMGSSRFRHVMGVEGMACHHAHHWGVDPDKVLLAALLHDLLKEHPKTDLYPLVERAPVAVSDEDMDHPLMWHGIAAATWAREELGLEDGEVLEAVAWHTTGNAGLGPVGLVLYLADYTEPSRHFPHVAAIRQRVEKAESLEEAALVVAADKIKTIMQRGKVLHSRTLQMAEWLDALPSTPSLLASIERRQSHSTA